MKSMAHIRQTFRALANKNYRFFFIGQSISLVGTWMQQVAMSWLVYRLTGSALWLGLIGFLGQAPAFFLTPFAGVLADRYKRHRILMTTQILAMSQAIVLFVLVLTDIISLWHIIVLSILFGLINAFDIPARHAFTIEMIDKKEDLSNAIALNSSMVNLARLIGPSVAGIIIASAGEDLCFLLNALSYVAVIIALFMMKISGQPPALRQVSILAHLREGFSYAFGFPPIRYILFLLGLVSLMGVPYQVLMPIFAKEIFQGGPATLGFLMSMAGIGALIGAVYLAGRKTVLGLGKIIGIAAIVFGLGLFLFARSTNLWFSFVIVCIAGFAMMVQMAASNTVLQTVVDEDKRGRVMSFYTMAFMGTAPFGALIAGWLASKIGAPSTLMIGGICCVAGGIAFLRKLPIVRETIRPVYLKKGIIQEIIRDIREVS
ncbi:MAG TPA: MFS transporter [Candidatus Omnitrophota bacterium]|nr:MFS transporter [Candidatus Omnitrophota bacterium]